MSLVRVQGSPLRNQSYPVLIARHVTGSRTDPAHLPQGVAARVRIFYGGAHMGVNWDSDEDDEFDGEENSKPDNTPKGLRAHAKKLEKENAEFRRQLEEFQASTRKAALSDAIKAKNLNPKIAALVPKDVATDKLDEWLTEYGDVFGAAAPPVPESSPEDQEEFDNLGRISGAASRGESPNKAADMFSELGDKNLTHSRLLELIEAAGGGYGQG